MQNYWKFSNWYTQDLSTRKEWYSPVAEAYHQVRSRYPETLIRRVIDLAQLSPQAKILELGCGPGTATVSFAKLGFSMVCLEPSFASFQLAQKNCEPYPAIKIHQTTFEEYPLENQSFDAVLAATSFHWIPSEIRYAKAAAALRPKGSLILIWNTTLQPRPEVHQVLQEVYNLYAPTLGRYETPEVQETHLKNFGESVLNSGHFQDLISEQIPCELTYSVQDYLMLLGTYSPYLALEPQQRTALFECLSHKIQQNFGETLQLSNLSILQISRKLN